MPHVRVCSCTRACVPLQEGMRRSKPKRVKPGGAISPPQQSVPRLEYLPPLVSEWKRRTKEKRVTGNAQHNTIPLELKVHISKIPLLSLAKRWPLY